MHSHLGPLPSKRNSWEKSWHPGRWRTFVRILSCASVLVLTSDIAPSPKSPHRQSYQGVRGRVRKTEMSDRAGEVGSRSFPVREVGVSVLPGVVHREPGDFCRGYLVREVVFGVGEKPGLEHRPGVVGRFGDGVENRLERDVHHVPDAHQALLPVELEVDLF